MKTPRLKFPHSPRDWNAPVWNLPSAQEFLRARKIIAALHAELLLLEKQIEEQERAIVIEECGEKCEPTEARLAKAYFESDDWQRLWRELMETTNHSEALKTQWQNEVAK